MSSIYSYIPLILTAPLIQTRLQQVQEKSCASASKTITYPPHTGHVATYSIICCCSISCPPMPFDTNFLCMIILLSTTLFYTKIEFLHLFSHILFILLIIAKLAFMNHIQWNCNKHHTS